MMRNHLSIICAAAVVFGAASCQKANINDTSVAADGTLRSITVRMPGNGTRLGLDEATNYTVFEVGDEVFGWDASGSYTYSCTSVNADKAEFELISDYAPSSVAGTKVNLVYANGYDAEDVEGGSLSLDIKNQNATAFSQLPFVMTAQGVVAEDGGCEVTFSNETSYIRIKDCPTPAAGGMSFYSVEATNLYPQMTLTIGADGNFVRTVGAAATIKNYAEIVSDQNGKISCCMATFASPEAASEASVVFTAESAEGFLYYYNAGKKTVPANKIISISEKAFTTEIPQVGIAEIVESGDSFTDFTAAVTAANAYNGHCTIAVLKDFTNTAAQTISNPAGVTLKLNGYTLTISGKSTRISIASGSTLTIEGEGTCTMATATNNFVLDQENSTLILNGGTLSTGGTYAVVYATKGNFIMNGGEVTDSGRQSLALDFESPGKMELNGGKVTGGSSKHGAVYIGNTGAKVEINGAEISAPYATDNPALNLYSGKLVLNSGKIGSKNDRWGIKVGNGSFEMNGGTISAARYPVYCAGTGDITFTGGNVVEINAGWKVFFGSSDAKNKVTIKDGYFFTPHSATYPGFYTFGGTLTNMTVEVSGGYFTEDLLDATAGYNGKISVSGSVVPCTDIKDGNGNKYTYQVVPAL